MIPDRLCARVDIDRQEAQAIRRLASRVVLRPTEQNVAELKAAVAALPDDPEVLEEENPDLQAAIEAAAEQAEEEQEEEEQEEEEEGD